MTKTKKKTGNKKIKELKKCKKLLNARMVL